MTFAKTLQDAPQSSSAEAGGVDLRQLEDTYVLEEKTIDSSYIIGPKPGVSRYRANSDIC